MRWQEWLILKDEHLAPPKQKLKMIYLPAPPNSLFKNSLRTGTFNKKLLHSKRLWLLEAT